MELGINGIRLVRNRSGVGRYTEYLLRCWEKIDHPFQRIKVYSPEAIDLDLPEKMENVVVPKTRGLPNAYWEQVQLPRAHGSRSLLFCPSYVCPLFTDCRIVLIHHGSYERYPLDFTWWQRKKSKALYKASAKKADRIITVSESSKRDIIEFYGIGPEKITVIPPGVDSRLFKPNGDSVFISRVRKKYLQEDIPYILYVGKFSRRRNILSLIKAFMSLKREKGIPHKLILVGADIKGEPVTKLIGKHRLEQDVIHLSHTAHEELVGLYQACDLFIYPSSYEGFGMPVLEAMACGVPAIAIKCTSFLEFADGVAYLAEDGSEESLHQALDKVLHDQAMREQMKKDGPPRSQDYQWDAIALKTMDILIQVSKSI